MVVDLANVSVVEKKNLIPTYITKIPNYHFIKEK